MQHAMIVLGTCSAARMIPVRLLTEQSAEDLRPF